MSNKYEKLSWFQMIFRAVKDTMVIVCTLLSAGRELSEAGESKARGYRKQIEADDLIKSMDRLEEINKSRTAKNLAPLTLTDLGYSPEQVGAIAQQQTPTKGSK